MAIATWSNRYETGIGEVDEQHRSLFGALNQLADSFREGRARDQVKASLDFLVGYTQEHFQTEERYMRELGYPRLAEHMGQHASLMEQVRDLQMAFEEGQSVVMDLAIFLADWLQHHIHESDLAYVRFMKESPQK
jgi:hemerythrin